ncbi:hypothetical protein [Acinetobacter baumannii]|uniref:hypothetical protein n=1 Tax=Acinetobacter baumannii TaxID=470 RepID=UPI00132FEF8B|nr:hypothetical protein [Acinetobacter baumannii]
MAVPHTTVLSLLGKEVSFSVLLDDQIKSFFPSRHPNKWMRSRSNYSPQWQSSNFGR